MRVSSLLSPTLPGCRKLWSLLALAIATVSALETSKSITQPSLDLSDLGRVGLVGDFDSISVFQYSAQSESSPFSNGSQNILAQLPNGLFTVLELADASINAMCVYELKDGTQRGIVVGGNFTSIGEVEASGIAIYTPDNNKVEALPKFNGKVNALFCDKETSSVYVGGMFDYNNTKNALVWEDGKWTELPFQGFDGVVETIVKSNNDSVIFGGRFDSLNNFTAVTPQVKNAQTVNIGTANITAIGTTTTETGFKDPAAITCSNSTSGAQWLVEDGSQGGSWKAGFQSEFTPTKLRLTNANHDGRGTKTFRFTASDQNAIMNLTYTDENGKKQYCDASCNLTQSDSPQDFTFVNQIAMHSITINVFEFYGDGAGLAGVELFQDDIYSFASPALNEPACAAQVTRSNSTFTGDWTTVTGVTDSTYLSADVATGDASSFQVVFEPHIQQSGDYDVLFYTPGCKADNTCTSRGEVNVTVTFANDAEPTSTTLFQTNDFPKYDKVYSGHVDIAGTSFRPRVTLTPTSSQTSNPAIIVAQKVQFKLLNNSTSDDDSNGSTSNSTTSSGDVNGIYEYFPGTHNTTDPSKSIISSTGFDLSKHATISSLAVVKDITFVGGNFSTNDSSSENFFSIDSHGPVLPTPENGLTGGIVDTMLLVDDLIYIGGSFTSTGTKGTSGLASVAIYDTGANKWGAMGAGVNGNVNEMVLVEGLNLTTGAEDCIAVSGDFTQVKADTNGNPAVDVNGFAIWVPSKSQWLEQMTSETLSISGVLSASVQTNDTSIYSGSVASNSYSSTNLIYLTSDGQTIEPSSLKSSSNSGSSSSKRDLAPQNFTGAYVGAFYTSDSNNLTILGGNFAVDGNSGTVRNLVFIDGSSSNVTGITDELSQASTVRALNILDTTLFVGGALEGPNDSDDIAGMVIWDLEKNKLAENQPPALKGSSISVNAISTQPGSKNIYVGGSFDSAGALPCSSLCIFDNGALQWDSLGADVAGQVNTMYWVDKHTLLVGGDLTINNTATYLVIFDAKSVAWVPVDDAGSIPGPVSSLSLDSSTSDSVFVSGASTDEAPFLMKLQDKKFTSLADDFASTTIIRDVQVLPLTQSHASSKLVKQEHTLLVTGSLTLKDYGNASAATYNGTTWTPFLLSSKENGDPGSVATFISEKAPVFGNEGKKLAKGFVILISLAIALALMFLIVVAGVLISYIRRRREGYVPAPTMAGAEKSSAMQDRLPPESLFSSVGPNAGRQGGAAGAPMI